MRRRGFTLLEMMVTVAIVGIMAGLSVVGGRQMLAYARVNSAASALSGALNDIHLRARSARCGQLVVLTPSAPFSAPPPGFPGQSLSLVEVAKRDCGPYNTTVTVPATFPTYGTLLSAYTYLPPPSGQPQNGDSVVYRHNLGDFFSEPGVIAPTGKGLTPTNGIGLAYNETGALVGYFTMTTSSVSSWVNTPTNGFITFRIPVDGGVPFRSVCINSEGTSIVGQCDGGI